MWTHSIWELKQMVTHKLTYSDLCELFPIQVTKTPHNQDSSSLRRLWGAFVTVLVPLGMCLQQHPDGNAKCQGQNADAVSLNTCSTLLIGFPWHASLPLNARAGAQGAGIGVSALVLAVLMLLGTPHFLKGLKFISCHLREYHRHVADPQEKGYAIRYSHRSAVNICFCSIFENLGTNQGTKATVLPVQSLRGRGCQELKIIVLHWGKGHSVRISL